MNKVGTLYKLKTKLNKKKVSYELPLGEESFELNKYIGQKVSLKHTGKKFCLATGKEINKTYGQGYSYPAFISLAQCDQCIMSPEMCHFDKGTCREPEWANKFCFSPHIVYLSLTSDLKVGITRKTQIPTRFIDQGAFQALPVLEVSNRFHSGLIEDELKSIFKDRTNWRNMLKGECAEVDLFSAKEKLLKKADKLITKLEAKVLDHELIEIEYPLEETLEKFSSFNFDKEESLEDTLLGIKGQYLIFPGKVLNVRKFQGYEIAFKG